MNLTKLRLLVKLALLIPVISGHSLVINLVVDRDSRVVSGNIQVSIPISPMITALMATFVTDVARKVMFPQAVGHKSKFRKANVDSIKARQRQKISLEYQEPLPRGRQ